MNLLTRYTASLLRSSTAPRSAVMQAVSDEILNRMSDLFLAINDRGRIVFANEACLRFLSRELCAVVRLPYQDIAADFGGDAFSELVDGAITQGQNNFGNIARSDAKGTFAVRVHPVTGGLHVFLTALDGETQALCLGPARGEVGDPSLLAELSRELHGTVQAVLGASEFLLSPDQAQVDRLECVRSIRSQVARMGRVAVDLSDLGALVREAPKLHRLALPMAVFFEQMSSEWALIAKEHNINFAMSSSGAIPSHITTDPVRLKQILWDMLGYVIGHNEAGGLDVRVTCAWAEGNAPARIAFTIKDHIPGQPIDETWMTQRVPASGLTPLEIASLDSLGGLWLRVARLILTAMKGELYVLTTRGVGESATALPKIAGFGLELSLHGQPDTLVSAESFIVGSEGKAAVPVASRRPLEGAHILVVEDAPDSQFSLARMLRIAGAEVHIVGSGLEGVELALAGAWHLILMDTHISGGLDGYEAVRHLRQAGFDRPIIALAARPSSAERRRVLVSGFDAYLPKPIDRLMLIEVVAEQLIRAGRAASIAGFELPPSDLLH